MRCKVPYWISLGNYLLEVGFPAYTHVFNVNTLFKSLKIGRRLEIRVQWKLPIRKHKHI